jgi:hypothetical protein
MTFTPYQILWVSKDKIEHNEMGGACRAYRRKERFIHVFGDTACGKENTLNT